jgi:hypothetical protein
MGLSAAPLPMDRVHLINPGQSVTVGDRRLTAVKPPVYDNPITTGFVDDRSGILFSSDCFGALLPAVPQDAADLDTAELQAGQVRWATIDSPWVQGVDRNSFGHALDRVRAIEPTMVCSSHLPPAPGAMLDLFVESLAIVPAADSFAHDSERQAPAGNGLTPCSGERVALRALGLPAEPLETADLTRLARDAAEPGGQHGAADALAREGRRH